MATVIDTCGALTDAECGYYVKTTCAANPESCGVYYEFFDAAMFSDILIASVPVVLLAYAFKVGKKLLHWNL